MNKKNLLTIWARRAIPALALAATAGVMLPSCEKEPIQQHDAVIYYYYNNNENPQWKLDTLNKHMADKHVRNIYITVAPGETFKYCNADDISSIRVELRDVMDFSPKFSGRGNFDFKPGVCTYGDSVDLIKMGFSINKQNQR